MRAALLMTSLLVAALAGCTASDDPVLRLAFVQPDDAVEPSKHPERLAEALEEATGRETEVYFVQDAQLALQAVDSGQADAAFVDAAAGWFAWQQLGLDAAAAFLESDGRPYYVASAWVLDDSPYQTMADVRGEGSCHTGLLKSAGMFMPLGWLIKEGLAQPVGEDRIESIQPTAEAYFGEARIPPSDADAYGNYAGALRCLSEGLGAVSFGKDTTPATFCGPQVASAPSWCRPVGEYRELQSFGRVPSHPVMVGDLGTAKRADLVDGLVALSATEEGKAILQSVLGTKGVVTVDSTEAHLGEFADLVQHVPGMSQYVEGQLSK